MTQPITQAYVKTILSYDEQTGVFVWLRPTSQKIKAGQVAGTRDKNGYVRVKLNGKKYQAHRLAWLYVHGYFPPEDTDHINRVRDDNRIANLRPATRSENKRNSGGCYGNSKSGIKGVHQRGDGKWRALYWDGSRNVSLGSFSSVQEAAQAYELFAPEPQKQVQESLL